MSDEGDDAAAAPQRRKRSNEIDRLLGSPGAGGQCTRLSTSRRIAASDEAHQAMQNDNDDDVRTRAANRAKPSDFGPFFGLLG